MECLSSPVASKPASFCYSYLQNPISILLSTRLSAHYSYGFAGLSVGFRGVCSLRKIQPGVAAATVAGIATEVITADPSVAPKKLFDSNQQYPSASKATIFEVLVPIGYGTEEMEAVILVRVMRQAGAHVTVASVESELEVEASCGLKLVADTLISSCSDKKFDLIALPGGMPGSARLRDCQVLRTITSKHAEENRLYGAICAAPAVTLLPWGLLKKKQTTCHPAFMDRLSSFWAVKSNIQISGELTTSRGPGTTFEFALSLVEQLLGESVALKNKESLLLNTEDDRRIEEFNTVEWLLDQPPHVLIPVANGCEEIEIVTVVDILRRANANVVVASVEKSLQILASHGTKIVSDKLIDTAADSSYDLIVLPGGLKGSKRLSKSKVLRKLLEEQELAGRMYGAVCSSLALLQKQGLLKDKMVAAHTSISNKLANKTVYGVKVVIDGRLITSKGLATSMDFALAIVSKLFGHARARSVAEGLVFEFPKS